MVNKETRARQAEMAEFQETMEADFSARAGELQLMYKQQAVAFDQAGEGVQDKFNEQQKLIENLSQELQALRELNKTQSEQLATLKGTQTLVSKLLLDVESLHNDGQRVKTQISDIRAQTDSSQFVHMGQSSVSSMSTFVRKSSIRTATYLLDNMRLFLLANSIYHVAILVSECCSAPQRWLSGILFTGETKPTVDKAWFRKQPSHAQTSERNSTSDNSARESGHSRANDSPNVPRTTSVENLERFEDEWANFFDK
eukprot:TRINITY_DN17744_c0_g1_i4.p1 TRINITY_DN17744_c0_g1~~TRINITY_DN17744_c0_g1_i4.p1  ORF type:complete len:256 (+),score=38.04 TRINITY_DN17744_c0_g1_i4:242-1009(+)